MGKTLGSRAVKARSKIAVVLVVLMAGLAVLPVISYSQQNRQLEAERARVHNLIRVGQSIGDAQTTLAQNGYRFHSDTPARFLSYQQLLVISGDTTPSTLDTLFYVMGSANPLRTQSPYVVIAANLDGVVTGIE